MKSHLKPEPIFKALKSIDAIPMQDKKNNPSDNNIWETWLAGKTGGRESRSSFLALNSNAVQISDGNHLMANGYANSWIIDPEKICAENPIFCTKNPDGTYDMELVVEFWPQRFFYVGLAILGITLLACLGYLGYDWQRRRPCSTAVSKPELLSRLSC